MVSTTALSVGINIKDIRVVIHYNRFFSLKNFIQETGRVGRDGYPSISYVIISSNDFRWKCKKIHNIIKRIYKILH